MSCSPGRRQCVTAMSPEDILKERISDVYSMLVSWLNKERRAGNIRKYYTDLGKRRYNEGIPLSEVIMAFMLLKRHLWLFTPWKSSSSIQPMSATRPWS